MSSIVSVVFVPPEVTIAVSHSSSLRPLNTRQSVCVNVWVSVCVFIVVGQFRVRLVLSK